MYQPRSDDDEGRVDFVVHIVDAFTLTGRGTVVIGPVVSGVVHSGDRVEIWDGETLVATANADVGGVRKLDKNGQPIPHVALLFRELSVGLLRSGQVVRRPAPNPRAP